jgi:hypothetical protein
MDIEHIIRLSSGAYLSSVMALQVMRRMVTRLEPETLELMGEEIQLCVDTQGVLASSALSTLAEIQASITEDEWFSYHAALPSLKMMDEDIARYRALVAMDKAGVPLPDQDNLTFQFGPDTDGVAE